MTGVEIGKLFSTRWRIPLLALFLSGFGCGDPCAKYTEMDPSVEIGTGWETFTEIDDITGFERGPQGGFHIYASIRAFGIYGGNTSNLGSTMPSLTYTLESETGNLTGGFTKMPRPMQQVEEGWVQRLGDLAILSSYEPSEMEGATMNVFVEVEDVCGQSASKTAKTVLSEGAF